jgi:hypothetical protein
VRGSPLTRFILLTFALAATAWGLLRVTAVRGSSDFARPSAVESAVPVGKNPVPFRLLLSAPAASVEMEAGKPIQPSPGQSTISGVIELDPKNPHVALIIKWQQAAMPGEHRFAKLTLESPGQPTFTHVFDGSGDIDDFLELPINGGTP